MISAEAKDSSPIKPLLVLLVVQPATIGRFAMDEKISGRKPL